jgi:hypothetical protein
MSKQSFQPATLESLARAHGTEALGIVVDIMRDCPNPELRMKAAQVVLDRGHGKATQAVITMPVRQAVATKLYALSDEELLELAAEARGKMQMAEGGVPPKEGDPLGLGVGEESPSQPISLAPSAMVTKERAASVMATTERVTTRTATGKKYKDAIDADFDELDVAK